VRLKDCFDVTFSPPDVISIPFGAIKRSMVCFSIFRFNPISIPFGAIKSMEKKYYIQETTGFQFLLVRLKVSFISLFFFLCFKFQFLLVRLKDHHLN